MGFRTRLQTSAAAITFIIALQGGWMAPACAAPDAAPPGAVPQPNQPNSASSSLEEIVVTAQKRTEKLRDVGITVTAATGQQLQAAGVTDVSQLKTIVTGFSASIGTSGFPIYSIRGVNLNALQASAAPAVSAYLDQAPLPYSVMTGGLFLDVKRIEVLKGPQGTLFGQNSTGGAINVIPNQPTDYFTWGEETEVNNFGQLMLSGYVGGALTDTLKGRIAVSTTQFGAWQKGYDLNSRENGDQDKTIGRAILDWTPRDDLKVALTLNGDYDLSELAEPQITAVTPAVPAVTLPAILGYRLPTNNRDADIPPSLNTRVRDNTYQISLRADYEVSSNLTLTSLTNYAATHIDNPINSSGTGVASIIQLDRANVSTVTQEVRAAGDLLDGEIHYIFGGNYEYDDNQDLEDNSYPGYSGFPHGTTLRVRYFPTNEAESTFGNVDYNILPEVKLTGGIRFTSTTQTVKGCVFDGGNGDLSAISGSLASAIPGAVPGAASAYVPGGCSTVNNVGPASQLGLPVNPSLSQSEDNVSWRMGIDYKPTPDSLIYGLVARGYKAGVFNSQINLLYSQFRTPVREEKLTDYEVGTKLTFFDQKLDLNLAGFYYNYVNKQFFTYVPTPPFATFATLVNIPASNEKGIDFDFTARPIAPLTIRGGLTYLYTKVGQYNGFGAAGNPQVFSYKQFDFAPPVSATFDVEYRAAYNDTIDWYVGGHITYNDQTYSDLGEPANAVLPSFTLFDARLGIDSSEGWHASIWGRNLTDKHYLVSAGLGGGDTEVGWSGLPRTFGVSAGVDF